jgi:hypothetical membrane protein
MSRKTRLLAGSIILIANAVQWVIAEAMTASQWSDPGYSYARNYISDLGVPGCGTEFQGRILCSPWHPLMNTSFMLEGILFAAGALLIASVLLDGRILRIVTVLGVLHGIGMVLVGLFHGALNGPDSGLVVHVTGAGVGILCANAAAIIIGSRRNLGLPQWYRAFSIAAGLLGLLSEGLVNLSTSTAGVFERGGVYSWLLWSVVTGGSLLAGRLRHPAVVDKVAA